MTLAAEMLSEKSMKHLRNARRFVIKFGTSLVTDAAGNPCVERLQSLVSSITSLRRQGRQIVLVSSGAIGLGSARLGLNKIRLQDLVLRQASAAVGQSLLMHLYEDLFRAFDVKIAQILLTEDDFTDRQRYSNLRHAMERLLKLGVIPIVNENDSVATAELEYFDRQGRRVFSDNDRLAALIMSKLEGQALIILTNVDGLLIQKVHAAPNSNRTQEVVPFVTEINAEIKSKATGPSLDGRGGMITKLEAAEIVTRAGGIAVIANGTTPGILDQIFSGQQVGTTFLSDRRLGGKRRWIKYAAEVKGKFLVNAGAQKAIIAGKGSLLSSGVLRVDDKFKALDVVSLADADGNEFARGITNYPSHEAETMIIAAGSQRKGSGLAKTRVLVTRNNIVVND